MKAKFKITAVIEQQIFGHGMPYVITGYRAEVKESLFKSWRVIGVCDTSALAIRKINEYKNIHKL